MSTGDGMMEQPDEDTWEAGQLYEPYVGRWSRLVAREFLNWLEAPANLNWIDVGCGTGALTQTILDHASPRFVMGVDPSPGFITHARAHVVGDPVGFEVAGAESLPADSASVDVAVSGLVLNFLPQPLRGVTEMARVTRFGGTVAAYVWDYAEKMELIRHFWDAAAALDADALRLDEGLRFPVCRPEPLAALFIAAGLLGVEVRPIDILTDFNDFDDYWLPFLSGQGPAPGYAMSLDETRRNMLRERLRLTLPFTEDGRIRLLARAWAVCGRKP